MLQKTGNDGASLDLAAPDLSSTVSVPTGTKLTQELYELVPSHRKGGSFLWQRGLLIIDHHSSIPSLDIRVLSVFFPS